MPKNRVFYIDNLKALLILCILIGHGLECYTLPYQVYIYRLIYVFHMPAFAFLSGLCYKSVKSNKTFHLLYVYILLQTLYFLFKRYVLGEDISLHFSTPIWILWYLLSLFFWKLLTLPILFSKKNGVFIVFGSILLALAIGFDSSIGYPFSISRTVCFYPYFLCGAWIKAVHEESFTTWVTRIPRLHPSKLILYFSAIFIGYIYNIIMMDKITNSMLYMSTHYSSPTVHSALKRAAIMGFAFVLIFVLLSLSSNKKIPVITTLGQNTFSVYVVHGFVRMYAEQYGWLTSLRGFLFYMIICLLFALPPISGLINEYLLFGWLNRKTQ